MNISLLYISLLNQLNQYHHALIFLILVVGYIMSKVFVFWRKLPSPIHISYFLVLVNFDQLWYGLLICYLYLHLFVFTLIPRLLVCLVQIATWCQPHQQHGQLGVWRATRKANTTKDNALYAVVSCWPDPAWSGGNFLIYLNNSDINNKNTKESTTKTMANWGTKIFTWNIGYFPAVNCTSKVLVAIHTLYE